MQLLDPREEVRPDAALGVVGGALVRVLAVGEVELLLEDRREAAGNASRAASQDAIAAS